MRLYPNEWPMTPDEPTSEKFEIIFSSDDCGEGLITKKLFNKNDVVFSFIGLILPYQNLFTLEYDDHSFIYDPYVTGKILHSCEPNMYCCMPSRTFIALRDIYEGEILTMDYEQTESKLFRAFTCRCGSSKCRHEIRGNKL